MAATCYDLFLFGGEGKEKSNTLLPGITRDCSAEGRGHGVNLRYEFTVCWLTGPIPGPHPTVAASRLRHSLSHRLGG